MAFGSSDPNRSFYNPWGPRSYTPEGGGYSGEGPSDVVTGPSAGAGGSILPWVQAGGSALSGIGNIWSATHPPQGPAQIDPAIQAELEGRQTDISAYLASLQGPQQAFQQAMDQYKNQYMQELQKQYSSQYGGIESGLRSYAEDIMAGKTSPFTENLLAREGVSTGQETNKALEQAKQQLASLNIDPSSPAYSDMLRQTMSDVNRRSLSARGDIMAQFQNPEIAQRILQNAQQSNRLAGMNTPDIPVPPWMQGPSALAGPGSSGSGQGFTVTGPGTAPTAAGGYNPGGYLPYWQRNGYQQGSNYSPYGPGYSFQGYQSDRQVAPWLNGPMKPTSSSFSNPLGSSYLRYPPGTPITRV